MGLGALVNWLFVGNQLLLWTFRNDSAPAAFEFFVGQTEEKCPTTLQWKHADSMVSCCRSILLSSMLNVSHFTDLCSGLSDP